jgi:hypothetical protein
MSKRWVILFSFVAVVSPGFVIPDNVCPPRTVSPWILPSTIVTRFTGTMTRSLPYHHLGFLACTLVHRYFPPRRMISRSHVHSVTFKTCHALRPRECSLKQPKFIPMSFVFHSFKSVDHSKEAQRRGSIVSTFRLTACPSLCLRLTHVVTAIDPRLDLRCGGRRFPGRTFTSDH